VGRYLFSDAPRGEASDAAVVPPAVLRAVPSVSERLARAVKIDLIAVIRRHVPTRLQKRVPVSTFPMFIPSLSWQIFLKF
jgi:hypothetical protein